MILIIVNSYFYFALFIIAYIVYWIIWNRIRSIEEENQKCFEEMFPKKVKIIKCDNQFYWYEKLSKENDLDLKTGLIDPEKEKRKIFEVEKFFTSDGLYKTVSDIAGPGVKGFIHPKDVHVIEAEFEKAARLKKELNEHDKWKIFPFPLI